MVNKYDFPVTLALGLNYKQSRNVNYTLDVRSSGWSDKVVADVNRSIHFGTGYEYQGTGGRFRPYYTNMAYRFGLGYDRLYVLETNEYRVTGGFGFPLGRRGSSLDLTIEAGQRGTIESQGYREGFLKVYIGLTGAGIWGRTRRR